MAARDALRKRSGMRNRKYLIGALLGVVGAMALASTASAAVVGQTYKSVVTTPGSTTPSTAKFDRKKLTAVQSFRTDVDTQYNVPPDTNYTPAANRTVLDFDDAFKFFPAGIPQCTTLTTADTDDAARAKCPTSIVGQGSSVLKTIGSATINAKVLAVNGPLVNGHPSITLHVDPTGVPTKPNLVGELKPGNILDVTVPVTPGAVIVHFDTIINKVKSSGAAAASKGASSAKKKKKKKFQAYYVMTKCNDKSWAHTETTTFTDASTKSGSYTQACKQKPKPKKKKK